MWCAREEGERARVLQTSERHRRSAGQLRGSLRRIGPGRWRGRRSHVQGGIQPWEAERPAPRVTHGVGQVVDAVSVLVVQVCARQALSAAQVVGVVILRRRSADQETTASDGHEGAGCARSCVKMSPNKVGAPEQLPVLEVRRVGEIDGVGAAPSRVFLAEPADHDDVGTALQLPAGRGASAFGRDVGQRCPDVLERVVYLGLLPCVPNTRS